MNNRIGFGTGGISDNSLCELIKKSLEIGYRLFDIAECYNNEHFIGNAISDSDINRESLCIICCLL